ncbi:hypothetical protein [Sporomusa termitida]|uniref:Uncharacterized protein n=1 Tax=Sporomusa termitida TaxID=2377 RepID=A0A517DYA4_9FIRM|nr:hypothetical protein [Sporomusa termitida]QDR82328.1 hypothetical protein SPTER_37530 [Sporomusa termitida]
MKIYNLAILIEPKAGCAAADIMQEISGQIEKDGPEIIFCQVNAAVPHPVVSKSSQALFPACLTAGTNRLVVALSLPTRKDLGRRWFLKRLAGENKSSYRLIATTDVEVIHIEATNAGL